MLDLTHGKVALLVAVSHLAYFHAADTVISKYVNKGGMNWFKTKNRNQGHLRSLVSKFAPGAFYPRSCLFVSFRIYALVNTK
jgi:hypothetical protein